ncbi:hypothetical protein [Paraburkholderia caribensis]|uniref:hypothetical protein n=1 Tax=Paraburkholderia caribensis TaxID=75105 RepID=UPI001592503E|nr:hypothetical protein [Paraburkholderia caribensis]
MRLRSRLLPDIFVFRLILAVTHPQCLLFGLEHAREHTEVKVDATTFITQVMSHAKLVEALLLARATLLIHDGDVIVSGSGPCTLNFRRELEVIDAALDVARLGIPPLQTGSSREKKGGGADGNSAA